ncbi:MAG: polysaccharide deacetylase family protein [Cyclobacteriaceae bacterium]|nr:polysaccharide deacetylase family protein [Cyclobacteriaceae bacterium]
MMYVHKTPAFVKALFPAVVWSMKGVINKIYLTFDDGPDPAITPEILSILKEKEVKATFFLVGGNVGKQPEIVKDILESGHTVGNHTFSHMMGWKSNASAYLRDTDLCQQKLEEHGVTRKLFRPPYGKLTPGQWNGLNRKAYEVVMWDVLSGDFDQKLSAEHCLKATTQATAGGSVVVFHDNAKFKEKVLRVVPEYIDYFLDREYSFETL